VCSAYFPRKLLEAKHDLTSLRCGAGWASLIGAAGVSYYFARKEIDARRKLQRESGVRNTEKKEWYERLGDPSSVPPTKTKPLQPTTTAKAPPDETG